jgi:N-acetylglutamate synthase-like GNAT family acetyltransferase
MLTIRKASLKDYKTIINVMEESATEEELRGFVPPEGTSSKFLEELKEALTHSNHGVVIAEKQGIALGFAYYRIEDDFVEIEEVDVRKKNQGQGVGRALVQNIESVARERGLNRFVTGTSVNKEGRLWRAYGFWIHMGFKDTERIDGTHGLTYVKFVKQLRNAAD